MIRNHTIMLDDSTGVDDDVVADSCSRIDNCTCHDHQSITDDGTFRNDRSRMDCSNHCKPGSTRGLIQSHTGLSIFYRAESDECRVHAALTKLLTLTVVAAH